MRVALGEWGKTGVKRVSTEQQQKPRTRPLNRLAPLSPAARITLLVLGWVLILLGLAGLVLPGLQGVLTLILGAALLSLVSRRIYRGLRRLFKHWPWGWARVLRLRRKVHGWFSSHRS